MTTRTPTRPGTARTPARTGTTRPPIRPCTARPASTRTHFSASIKPFTPAVLSETNTEGQSSTCPDPQQSSSNAELRPSYQFPKRGQLLPNPSMRMVRGPLDPPAKRSNGITTARSIMSARQGRSTGCGARAQAARTTRRPHTARQPPTTWCDRGAGKPSRSPSLATPPRSAVIVPRPSPPTLPPDDSPVLTRTRSSIQSQMTTELTRMNSALANAVIEGSEGVVRKNRSGRRMSLSIDNTTMYETDAPPPTSPLQEALRALPKESSMQWLNEHTNEDLATTNSPKFKSKPKPVSQPQEQLTKSSSFGFEDPQEPQQVAHVAPTANSLSFGLSGDEFQIADALDLLGDTLGAAEGWGGSPEAQSSPLNIYGTPASVRLDPEAEYLSEYKPQSAMVRKNPLSGQQQVTELEQRNLKEEHAWQSAMSIGCP